MKRLVLGFIVLLVIGTAYALLSRYQYFPIQPPTPEGPAMVRVDRWTGRTAVLMKANAMAQANELVTKWVWLDVYDYRLLNSN